MSVSTVKWQAVKTAYMDIPGMMTGQSDHRCAGKPAWKP